MATLYVVGIGPGGRDHFTKNMVDTIESVDAIVGYTPYIEYLGDLVEGKKLFSTGMKSEIERCEEAIHLTKEGYNTAIISTGDAGLYGMAGPIFELSDGSIDIEVIPGISANFAAASRVGAPIMHDFVTISLSDLLTPWDLILRRMKHAALGDFVITLYNPRSKGRPNHLKEAIDVLRENGVDGSRPVAVVKNACRDNEEIFYFTLDTLDYEVVDMVSLVIIGNSKTFMKEGKMVTPRGYENK